MPGGPDSAGGDVHVLASVAVVSVLVSAGLYTDARRHQREAAIYRERSRLMALEHARIRRRCDLQAASLRRVAVTHREVMRRAHGLVQAALDDGVKSRPVDDPAAAALAVALALFDDTDDTPETPWDRST
jgi:hypothetical protein